MMSRTHRAPFALASNGDVLLNVAMFDTPTALAVLLEQARRQGGQVFIGVVLSRREVNALMSRLEHATRDAAAWAVGRRQKNKDPAPTSSSRGRASSP